MFDLNNFLQQTTTEASSTERIQVPEGEFIGVISDIKAVTKQIQGEDRAIMSVTWDIDDPTVKAATKRDKNTVKQDIFLDMTAQGALDSGKGMNVGLGLLRKALNQNTPGQPWSPAMLKGQAGRVQVTHRIAPDGQVFAEIKKVAGL